MIITSVQLQNFRSLESTTFTLHPRLTVFLGPNGSGKTNILEALALLSVPRSFRSSKDSDLVMWRKDFTRVEGHITFEHGPERELVVFINSGKKLQVDGQIKPVSEFLGQLAVVVFSPEEVGLLSGAPARRRAFIDQHLSLLSPTYLQQLIAYQQVLVRRNKLISRHHWPEGDDLDYWNNQQVELGSRIIESRLAAVEQLNIALPSSLSIAYSSNLLNTVQPLCETFRQKQASIFEREKVVGYSLLGPQRDDWLLQSGDEHMDLGRFGSRGQQRMGVVALKQAQLTTLSHEREESAVLLLDDVLSELDAQNQELLFASITKQQTVITTPTLSDVPSPLLSEASVFEFNNGAWVNQSR